MSAPEQRHGDTPEPRSPPSPLSKYPLYPRTGATAASPATAPDSTSAAASLRATGMRSAAQAVGDIPTSTISRPMRVHASHSATANVTTTASGSARLTALPCSEGRPNASRRASLAPGTTSGVRTVPGIASPATSPSATSASAMRFIMMVEMTSCAPYRARSTAGTTAHAAPASRAVLTTAGSASHADVPGGSLAPTAPTASPATASCPSAPMLNRPALSARSTATPDSSSGVAL